MIPSERRPYRNTDGQSDFAKRLVNAIGFDDAVRECYENQWLGTLIYIQQLQRKNHT
ncbi:MAG: hypothetical protein HWE30_12795 [Methylocystaceae bacterium]|nr:hypothetical protein [Methylocystaceae bacterium]